MIFATFEFSSFYCSCAEEVWLYDPGAEQANRNSGDTVRPIPEDELRAMFSSIQKIPQLKTAENNSDYLQLEDAELLETFILCDG